ncbi:hypothetical protein KPNJ1_01920 [Klebsiella pneumoniae 30660/NJST258_1]|nr:hypothetical protein KPNJ1_01920 [Klebsiella pneumoniae 30660/NJST258_1]
MNLAPRRAARLLLNPYPVLSVTYFIVIGMRRFYRCVCSETTAQRPWRKVVCLLSGGDGVKKNRWERRAKSHPGLNILAICHPAYTFN